MVEKEKNGHGFEKEVKCRMMPAAGRKRSLGSKPYEKVSLGSRRVRDKVDGHLVYPGKNVRGFGNSGKMVPGKI